MTHTRKWGVGTALCMSIGILTWSLASGATLTLKCGPSTLHGLYLYTGEGSDVSGNPIAESGWEIYNGNGKMSGKYSQSTNGTITSDGTYTGTYTVNSDCSGTLTTSDGSHYDQFLSPSGERFTWIETDSGSTFAGDEQRAVGGSIQQ